MPGDLVAVSKQVTRGTSTFTQRFWMKTDDVAEKLQKNGFDASPASVGSDQNVKAYLDTVKDMGGDPALADKLTRGWAGSAKSPAATQAQGAVAALLGRDMATVPYVVVGDAPDRDKAVEAHADASGAESKLRATVMAIHASTQAALADAPATLMLHRGVGAGHAGELRQAAVAQAAAGVHYDDAKISLNLNPLNCFTSDDGIARGFGQAVITMEVPKEAVLYAHTATPGLSTDTKHEKEYSVMSSGPVEVPVRDVGGALGQEIYEHFASKGLVNEKEMTTVVEVAHPAGLSKEQHHANIKAAGGKVREDSGVNVPGGKAQQFMEKLAQTSSLPKAPEKEWLARNSVTIAPETKAAKGTWVSPKLKKKLDSWKKLSRKV